MSAEKELIQSPGRTALANFLSNRLAIVGMTMFAFIFLGCFILSFIFPLDINHADSSQQHIAPGLNLMRVPRELRNTGIKTIDTGMSFSAGVDINGNVHVWGRPTQPALTEIPPNMGNITMIASGMDHILALNDRGQVFTWGNNRHQLGIIPEPVRRANIVNIAAGVQISAAVDDTNTIHVWGNRGLMDIRPELFTGEVKQITLNDTTGFVVCQNRNLYALSSRDVLVVSGIPQWIQGQVQSIAVTNRDGMALLTDGRIAPWGNNLNGEHNIPPEIQGRVKAIAAGTTHFTALLDDGNVASWGLNFYSQARAPRLTGIESIYSGYFQNFAIDANGRVFTWGLRGYVMGTDNFGRDIFRRLLEGGKITLTVGAIAIIISSIIGIAIGGIAGFFHGKVDLLLMRLGEVVSSIPFIPIVVILSVVVGSNMSSEARLVMIMCVLGFLTWPGISRITRGQILVEREKEFVTAAKALGVREGVIIFKHILPNILPVILVNITLGLAGIMLFEASLSFLGFGVMEPAPSWGNMLQHLTSVNIRFHWWRWVFPAVTLSLAVISISIIGDALRDAIDPKSNSR